jgi:hypothetical protein
MTNVSIWCSTTSVIVPVTTPYVLVNIVKQCVGLEIHTYAEVSTLLNVNYKYHRRKLLLGHTYDRFCQIVIGMKQTSFRGYSGKAKLVDDIQKLVFPIKIALIHGLY